HVHTRVADGFSGIDDVVAAARWADLSFVAITDFHQALGADIAGKDRNHVLMIGGEEIANGDGHFLALDVPTGWRDGAKDDDTAALMKAAHKAGGAVFIAHPFGAVRDFESKSWAKVDGLYDGIEVMNADAEWRDNNPAELLLSALIYTVNPDLALVRLVDRPEKNLAKWDELLAKRKVVGVCGADAHARVYLGYGRGIGFPSYLRVFRITKEHVLLGEGLHDGQNPPRDARAIVQALKEGHSYCAVDGFSGAAGLLNQVEGEGSVAGAGQSIAWAPGMTLRVLIPPGSGRPFIKVFKDGHEAFDGRGWRLDATLTGPGVYRTEVWLRQPGLTGGQRWTPWIIANPIFVTATAQPIPVERAGTPPPPAPTPSGR
ncbi:MAG TPA: hypothetical protein VMV18_06635, partial [bacterium]|nr:hypothetical protein [bacterium]